MRVHPLARERQAAVASGRDIASAVPSSAPPPFSPPTIRMRPSVRRVAVWPRLVNCIGTSR
ncbi:MAG: hypothetical protein ACK52I_20550 [Pseudomonadota bacterium]